MDKAFSSLKDEKVSLSVLGFVMMTIVWAYSWADGQYAKQSEFDELKSMIVDHTEEFRINNASQIIRDLKTDLRIAKATAAPDIELNRLEEQLEHAEEYKACLVRRQPNCKHLRDVE